MEDMTTNILSKWGFEDMTEKCNGKLIRIILILLWNIIDSQGGYTIICTT